LLGQLDKAVVDISNSPDREVNGRTISSAERALQVRRQQARDRAALTKTIEESQARIVKLQEEKAPFAKELRKVEAEVGPIKYIAALIYGDNPDANLLEKAVRWVIIILVIVFDPLAIMMLLAATESYRWERERKRKTEEQEKDVDTIPSVVPTDPVDAGDIPGHSAGDSLELPPVPEVPTTDTTAKIDYQILEDADDEEPKQTSTEIKDDQDEDEDDDNNESSLLRQAKHYWKLDNPDETLKKQRRLLINGKIDRLPWLDYLDDPRIIKDAGFGRGFPEQAQYGDQWIKVDELPTQLYKYNGEKWIKVDKTTTDSYAYNQAYIDYLITRISSGDYDPELLTDSEREQIEQTLRQEN